MSDPLDNTGPYLRAAFAALDELSALALTGELDAEVVSIGALLTRAQLLASFVEQRTRLPGRLRMVRT